MTTTNTHPDFNRTEMLTAEQTLWIAKMGIEAIPGPDGYGHYFVKGDFFIDPIRATDSVVYLLARPRRDEGDGVQTVATYPRLRDALRSLVSR